MTKIHVEKTNVDELADSLDRIFQAIYDELTNERKFKTNYPNLIELDKIQLDINIVAITEVLKKIKLLKKYNHNRHS